MLIPPTNAPLTNVSGLSDNTLTSAAVGAAGGIGLGVCLGLAPQNVLGAAVVVGALLSSSSRRR